MTRALIDAAIVWFEGIPPERFEDREQWHNLARQSGETAAEIIKELTNFQKQDVFKPKPLNIDMNKDDEKKDDGTKKPEQQ